MSHHPQVVYVENNQSNIFLMKMLFQRHQDFSLMCINDESDALHEITQQTPKLLIVDYDLTLMTGLEFVKSIRANAELTIFPIILLSSDHDPFIPKALAQHTYTECIFKPYQINYLYQKVKELIKGDYSI